jgi:hypothetical protein
MPGNQFFKGRAGVDVGRYGGWEKSDGFMWGLFRDHGTGPCLIKIARANTMSKSSFKSQRLETLRGIRGFAD